MATQTQDRAQAMTLQFQKAQQRRAALTAAFVALYLRHKVQIENPDAVERWLALVVPKIITAHETSAVEAVKFGTELRKLEVPATAAPYDFRVIDPISEDQLRASLKAVGINPYLKKAADIRRLDDKQYDPTTKHALIEEANQVASDRVARAVARHTQNGGRKTLEENAKNDPRAFGYVRVTKADPCFFCAMLASRGLEGGLYQRDSFDASDPRFVGDGDAKVHDGCGCTLKPVYTQNDKILASNQRFTDAWYEMSGNGDSDPLTNFRRNWEGRATHLKAS